MNLKNEYTAMKELLIGYHKNEVVFNINSLTNTINSINDIELNTAVKGEVYSQVTIYIEDYCYEDVNRAVISLMFFYNNKTSGVHTELGNITMTCRYCDEEHKNIIIDSYSVINY